MSTSYESFNTIIYFRDQLESFEMERRALLAQNEVAEGEAKKLAVQNGRLLGHQVRKSLC